MNNHTGPVVRLCSNPDCNFRFPVPEKAKIGEYCPKCGWITHILDLTWPQTFHPSLPKDPAGPVVEALLDSIRSTFNVGAMFRTADGAGLSHLHLCGTTATPENPKVAKTALGAELSVAWTYHHNNLDFAQSALDTGATLWALETGPKASSLFEAVQSPVPSPLLLVVGNEVTGVDPAVARLCNRMVWIPMVGSKQSLNVSIAFGVAAYTLRFAHQLRIAK
jgi:23S rRNA (guanosine2251-2'-O)-methyltransferase